MSLQLLCMILNYFHTFLLYFLIFLDIDACDFKKFSFCFILSMLFVYSHQYIMCF